MDMRSDKKNAWFYTLFANFFIVLIAMESLTINKIIVYFTQKHRFPSSKSSTGTTYGQTDGPMNREANIQLFSSLLSSFLLFSSKSSSMLSFLQASLSSFLSFKVSFTSPRPSPFLERESDFFNVTEEEEREEEKEQKQGTVVERVGTDEVEELELDEEEE